MELMERKKWQLDISNSWVEDEAGNMVAVIPEGVEKIDRQIIETAPDVLNAVIEFIENIKSGSHKPKKAVKKFETILIKLGLE